MITGTALKKNRARITAIGVVTGNRSIAFYLEALPIVHLKSLFLFIACYQALMYLTPLVGNMIYRYLMPDKLDASRIAII